ncbi:ornithine carbamoyltransferase [Sphingomonas sp.]|uniref:ornithine carbamoyltransferase n=1 Tax=Sphingomonas sp. TaxID=28214 RepID=UPI00286A244D|nr:ornithine carbamoyltransferase [Sphingomonas sp.]
MSGSATNEGLRHFLSLSDAGGDAIAAILNDAQDRKKARAGWPKGKVDGDRPLDGHVLAMIFEKNSTRTRVSFDLAMSQLGGSAIILDSGSSQLGRGESVGDTARVLSRFADAIMIRTDDHVKVEELAACASVPVINGLTDLSHPCQILADMLTLIERKGKLAGSKWAWFGDGNNVCNSLIEAASIMMFDVTVACPEGFEPDLAMLQAAAARGCSVPIVRDAASAAVGMDVIVTDTWTSMGQSDSDNRIRAMMPYSVGSSLMAAAGDQAVFMHCLPAHRGEEDTDEVIDGAQSAAWDEAENRLHAQKSLLLWCLGKL